MEGRPTCCVWVTHNRSTALILPLEASEPGNPLYQCWQQPIAQSKRPWGIYLCPSSVSSSSHCLTFALLPLSKCHCQVTLLPVSETAEAWTFLPPNSVPPRKWQRPVPWGNTSSFLWGIHSRAGLCSKASLPLGLVFSLALHSSLLSHIQSYS